MKNNNNYCVILAGGVGKRLWPVSRQDHPKQFIDFFGVGKSLLQLTVERMLTVVPADHIYVSTCEEYAAIAMKQLPEMKPEQFLLEPVRLSTGPAAVRATWHIVQRCRNANILVIPSGQFITNEQEFTKSIVQGFEYVATHRTFLALGVKTTKANTAYGYIQRGTPLGDGLYTVKSFTEKPEEQYAETFVKSGEFLWNTGIFLWNAAAMCTVGESIMPGLFHSDIIVSNIEEENDIVRSCYPAAERISIDLLLLENQQMDVLECRFGWSDVGSWPVMQDVLPKTADGNAIVVTPATGQEYKGTGGKVVFKNCRRTIVSVPEGVATVVQGLDGYLVALQGNVLIVTPNDNARRLKGLVTELQVMYGEEYL